MRTQVQTKLNELTNIDSGMFIADDIIEAQKTYFGYELYTNYIDSDFDKNYTYRVNITGYVIRLCSADENTQQIIDEATKEIISKLKDLNFKCNFADVSIENNISKIKITGYCDFNEINNKFIV